MIYRTCTRLVVSDFMVKETIGYGDLQHVGDHHPRLQITILSTLVNHGV